MQRQGNNALNNSHLAAVYAIYGIFYKIICWGLIFRFMKPVYAHKQLIIGT